MFKTVNMSVLDVYFFRRKYLPASYCISIIICFHLLELKLYCSSSWYELCHTNIFIYIGYIANKILASKLEIEREIEYSTVQYIDWVVLSYTCTLCAQGIGVLQSEHVWGSATGTETSVSICSIWVVNSLGAHYQSFTFTTSGIPHNDKRYCKVYLCMYPWEYI